MATFAGRYDLRELLGGGSGGEVHRAHDVVLGRDVAVKVLQPTVEVTDEARARMLREAQVAARFRHPGALDVYEVGETDGQLYIVMELVRGVSLAAAMANELKPSSAAGILALGIELADVLVAAHEMGLVHRDLKPGNIIVEGPLSAPTSVRVIDFGLAFLVIPPTEGMGRITVDDSITGTPAYMAPEQIDGREITSAADVYALGCVLYEIVTGRTPFIGKINTIFAGHMYLPPIPPSEVRPVLGSRFDELILAMLAKAPQDRPTGATVRATLEAITSEHPVVRSATGQSRAERAVPASGSMAAVPARARVRVRMVDVLDPGFTAELERAGVSIVDGDADIHLIPLDELGVARQPLPAGVPVIGLMASPTPRALANAIRGGIVAVVRWPTTAARLVAELNHVLGKAYLSGA